MITDKFKNILGIKGLHNRIYVIRNKSSIVYVGKAGAQCVPNRLCLHIRDIFSSKKGGSKLSNYLLSNHPRYLDWEVDIYTASDVDKIVKEKHSCLSCSEKNLYKHFCATKNKPVANAVKPRGRCICPA